jgi:hypothetical protein
LNEITEWEKFFDPSVNPQYSEFMRLGGYASARDLKPKIAGSIKAIEAFLKRNGGRTGFENFVAANAPGLDFADRRQIVAMLEKRYAKIKANFKGMEAVSKANPDNFQPSFKDHLKALVTAYQRNPNEARRKAIERLNGDQHAYDELDLLLGDWKGSATSGRATKLYKAIEYFAEHGEFEQTEMGAVLKTIITTRRDRWRKLSEELGLPMPKTFKVYRGDHDSHAFRWVLAAWNDNTSPKMRVRTRKLQCFTLDPNFQSFYKQGSVGVWWEADVPFEQTFFDQAVDDGYFVNNYWHEHEIAVGGFEENSIVTDKAKIKLRYEGKEYTYDRREELFDILRRRGVDIPTVSDENFGEALFSG